MKNFKNYFMYLAVLALCFTSCSKEESGTLPDDGEKAQLSFGTTLNDLLNNGAKNQTKAHFSDIPECSDEAPATVDVVISQSSGADIELTLDVLSDDLDGDGDMDYYTDYSSDLELSPGTYTLEEFIVRDSDGDMIWIAPIDDGSGDFDGYVTNPLPMDIDLKAGVKKYIDVEVLCFDDRMANLYGYLFFDIEGKELIEYCIFGNYCTPNGRHYTASYSVDVWNYEDGEKTDQLYDDLTAGVSQNNDGDYAADPLCIVLPDGEGDDEYWIEITILSTDEYNVTEEIIRAGAITDAEVRTLFDGDDNLDYYHFFEGDCGEEDIMIPDPREDKEYYKACLKALNGSEVVAFSYLALTENSSGTTLYTQVTANNTEANQPHPQHIHGFTDGTVSTCPDMSQDSNGDGLIQLGEGAATYGGVLLALENADSTFPTADGNGMYFWDRTFNLSASQVNDLDPLDAKTAVLHGMTVSGSYEATLPIACGPYVLQ